MATKFLQPHLRLFLSADVIGSTAYKSSRSLIGKATKGKESFEGHTPPWLFPMASFYADVDRTFSARWSQHESRSKKKRPDRTIPSPKFWKSNGDEVLYTQRLNDYREAYNSVRIWKEVVLDYRYRLKLKHPELDVKATAWVAGFPLTNSEVIFRKTIGKTDPYDTGDDLFYNFYLLSEFYNGTRGNELTRDFIGPSIDTGFRLCALATARKFVISVDLALMLANYNDDTGIDLGFRYDGRHLLKGVMGGERYPIFWIDMGGNDALSQTEDKLMPISGQNLNRDDIMKFCREFFSANNSKLIYPFIKEDLGEKFDNIPPMYAERLDQLQRQWPEQLQQRKIEIEATANKDAPMEPGLKEINESHPVVDIGETISGPPKGEEF